MKKRAARNKLKVQARVGPALCSVLQPGEQIIAGFPALTGPPRAAEKASVLAYSVAGLCAATGVLSGKASDVLAGSGFFVSTGFLFVSLRRRHVFVALTTRQLLRVRIGRTDHCPTGPVTVDQIAGCGADLGRAFLGKRSLRLATASGTRLRLSVPWWWRDDLALFFTSLQTAGAVVTGPVHALGPAHAPPELAPGLPAVGIGS